MLTNFSDTQEVSKDTLLEKYCKGDETTQEEIFARVAKGVASVEKTKALRDKWEKKFYQNMVNGAIGAGRIMGAAGTGIQATLNNCYLQGVGDSIQDQTEEGYPGIYIALKEAAETMRRGGGVGYDFSRIRPKNAEVKGTASFASGPCSYIDVFDVSCQTVESAGCFAGETLIDTDKGWVPIKEIVENTEIEYFANTHVGPRRITTRFNSGVKPIWLVTTATGHSVKVSPDHKFARYSETGHIVTIPISDLREQSDKHLLLLNNNSGGLVKTELVSIEELGFDETFDLEVDEVHLLSGNGIYTSNSRRGAQLASLRIDHPDIELYVVAKRTPGRWNNFNVSVFVTDEFMEAVKQDKEWELVHKAKPSQYLIDNDGCYQREDGKWVYKKVKARDLWDTIMKSNYDFAEPGILFGDNINNDNNLRYTEVIEATNP